MRSIHEIKHLEFQSFDSNMFSLLKGEIPLLIPTGEPTSTRTAQPMTNRQIFCTIVSLGQVAWSSSIDRGDGACVHVGGYKVTEKGERERGGGRGKGGSEAG